MTSYVFRITVLMFVAYVFCHAASGEEVERVRYVMGTKARVYLPEGDLASATKALNIIEKLDDLLSDYNPDSQIFLINSNAGIKPVTVDEEVAALLKLSKSIAQETNGFFDPTIGALTIGAYGFGRDGQRIPSEQEIKEAKGLVNYKDLVVTDDLQVFLKRKGMKIDLGGIGKGYAVDKAISVLKEKGVKRGLVAISGDIRMYGIYERVGIQDPFSERIIATFAVKGEDISVSTSGGYRRYIEVKNSGQRVHHLLVPSMGRSGGDFASVTVVMKDLCAKTDAYATALFVMGKQEAIRFLKNRKDIGVFFIYKDGTFFVNGAFKSMVKEFTWE